MKTEELAALGLNEEQIKSVFALNGKDIEREKKKITDLETERDDLSARLTTAETTLKGFEGIDPTAIKDEVARYRKAAEDAEKSYTQKLMQRDQKDWIRGKLDEYGVVSPFARRQITTDIMAEGSGLTWKDGAFFGFDDFMKSAKEKDNSLYQTSEEKQAAAEKAALEKKVPTFVRPTGDTTPQPQKYVPPKIF